MSYKWGSKKKIKKIVAFNSELYYQFGQETGNLNPKKPTMKITKPLPDTEHSLFYSATNALRCAGQEKLADDLDQRMEILASKTPKVAIFVDGGIVQAVRSNLGHDLDIEVVDADNEPEPIADDRWTELQNELDFGNF